MFVAHIIFTHQKMEHTGNAHKGFVECLKKNCMV
jgi:hypothetical protein